MKRTPFDIKVARLRHSATHTDQFGALYKYVNGQLFHYRVHHWGHGRIPCWGPISLPKGYELKEIVK